MKTYNLDKELLFEVESELAISDEELRIECEKYDKLDKELRNEFGLSDEDFED